MMGLVVTGRVAVTVLPMFPFFMLMVTFWAALRMSAGVPSWTGMVMIRVFGLATVNPPPAIVVMSVAKTAPYAMETVVGCPLYPPGVPKPEPVTTTLSAAPGRACIGVCDGKIRVMVAAGSFTLMVIGMLMAGFPF